MNNESITPFFIIGNPRSGTTLLRLMLNQHPKVLVPPECGFSVWLYEYFEHKDVSRIAIKREFVAKLFETRKFETWYLDQKSVFDWIKAQKITNYKELSLSIYLYYAKKNRSFPKLIGDKNNFYINYLAKIDKIFDNPPFLFIVRDGRDVACSYRKLRNLESTSKYAPKLPFKIIEIADEWNENNKHIINQMVNNPYRCLLIKYEDLIRTPKSELERICCFLGIFYDGNMLNYFKENDEPECFLDWKKKVKMPLDSTNYNKYKKILTNEQISQFNRIAKDVLEIFGYL